MYSYIHTRVQYTHIYIYTYTYHVKNMDKWISTNRFSTFENKRVHDSTGLLLRSTLVTGTKDHRWHEFGPTDSAHVEEAVGKVMEH